MGSEFATAHMLEHCLREDLNKTTGRLMAVIKPLKLVIENYPAGDGELLDNQKGWRLLIS
jgi:glutamyl/glutaminyl-tRNA synthetase